MEWRFAWKGEPLHHLAMVPLPFQGRHNESPLKGEMSVELTEGLFCEALAFGKRFTWEPLHRLRRSPSPFRGGF